MMNNFFHSQGVVLFLTTTLLTSILFGVRQVRAAEPVEDKDVVVLDTSNFHDWVNKQPYTVVEFYAPWCGHCQHLAPEYAKAAQKTKALTPPVYLAKVDADAEKELGSSFGVQGYPTLFEFRNGVKSEYKGPRDADGIVKYVKKNVVPPAARVSSVEDAESFVKQAKNSVIGVFREPIEASQMYKTFSEVALDMADQGWKFAYTAERAENPVAKHFKVSPPHVLVFVNQGGKRLDLDLPPSKFTEKAVKDYLSAAVPPTSTQD